MNRSRRKSSSRRSRARVICSRNRARWIKLPGMPPTGSSIICAHRSTAIRAACRTGRMSADMRSGTQRVQRARTRVGAEISRIVARVAEPLPDPAHAAAFGEYFGRFGDARVALLGEATHGTSEFYRSRAAITQRLIERHGFTIVALEADWPDAARVDAYVRHLAPRPRRGQAFARFPQWMWRNAEFADFSEWLRLHNRGLPEAQRVAVRGLDLYSLHGSINAVFEYLDRRDPARAAEARRRYGCLT